jgi:hypothetical protein
LLLKITDGAEVPVKWSFLQCVTRKRARVEARIASRARATSPGSGAGPTGKFTLRKNFAE